MDYSKFIVDNCADITTPYFMYFYDVLTQTVDSLLDAITKKAKLLYSVKANPNKSILQILDKQGVMFEVASEGELYHTLSCGVSGDKIVFSGQGKTLSGIRAAINSDVLAITAESIRELKDIRKIAESIDKEVSVIVRVNPSMENKESALQMGGVPSPYGIDEEILIDFLKNSNENLSIKGLFMYLGTNYHDHRYIVRNTRYLFQLAEKIYNRYGLKFQILDFGGGFGIPEFEADPELNLQELKSDLEKLMMHYLQLPCFSEVRNLFFESGRFVSARSGILVTKIIDIKVSRGTKYIILDGGINCLGIKQMEYRRVEPHLELVKLHPAFPEPKEKVCIVGTTCTSIDIVHKELLLPKAQIGDYIYFDECGAYIYEFSPKNFCGQVTLPEYLYKDQNTIIIRKSGDIKNVYGELFTGYV